VSFDTFFPWISDVTRVPVGPCCLSWSCLICTLQGACEL